MQISVEFFHTQNFKVKKWEGAVLIKLSNYIGRGSSCKCRPANPILQDIFKYIFIDQAHLILTNVIPSHQAIWSIHQYDLKAFVTH